MKYLYVIVSFVFFLFIALGCGGKADVQQDAQSQIAQYNSLPADRITRLQQQGVNVDILLETVAVTAAMEGREGVIQCLDMMSGVPSEMPPCEYVAKLYFHGARDILETVDVYFGQTCGYYAWLDTKGRVAYTNSMTERGLNYWSQMANMNINRTHNGQ